MPFCSCDSRPAGPVVFIRSVQGHGRLVAYLEEGKGPAGGEGLAYYVAKYVVSPPISLRRILSYDGQRVRYW
jgi:hypothetical protein